MAAALAVCGCGENATLEPAEPIALDRAAAILTELRCATIDRCCSAAEREVLGLAELAECRSRSGLYYDGQVADIADAVAAGDASYDAQKLGDCVQAYRELGCRAADAALDCLGAAVNGRRAYGEACTGELHCADGYCLVDFLPGDDTLSPIECVPYATEGQACDLAVCGEGLWCDEKCRPLKPDGARCQHGYECESLGCGSDPVVGAACGGSPYVCDGQ